MLIKYPQELRYYRQKKSFKMYEYYYCTDTTYYGSNYKTQYDIKETRAQPLRRTLHIYIKKLKIRNNDCNIGIVF